jgi:hypothetical protein
VDQSMIAWAVFLTVTALVCAWHGAKRWGRRRKAAVARSALQIELVREQLHQVCERQLAIYARLDNDEKGVAARIQDCRAIAEALYAYAPSVFNEHPDLAQRLEELDAFLMDLANQALPMDRAYAVQYEVEKTYPKRIFQVIRDTLVRRTPGL